LPKPNRLLSPRLQQLSPRPRRLSLRLRRLRAEAQPPLPAEARRRPPLAEVQPPLPAEEPPPLPVEAPRLLPVEAALQERVEVHLPALAGVGPRMAGPAIMRARPQVIRRMATSPAARMATSATYMRMAWISIMGRAARGPSKESARIIRE